MPSPQPGLVWMRERTHWQSNEILSMAFNSYDVNTNVHTTKKGTWWVNSSWPHAFAHIIARERRASHGPKLRVCWSPGEPARVQPPFPQDIWTLSSSVIRLVLIGAWVLARIWSISNHMANWIVILLYVYFSLLRKQLTYKRRNVNVYNNWYVL